MLPSSERGAPLVGLALDKLFMYLPVTATFAQWADSHEITCAFPFDSITIGQGRSHFEVT